MVDESRLAVVDMFHVFKNRNKFFSHLHQQLCPLNGSRCRFCDIVHLDAHEKAVKAIGTSCKVIGQKIQIFAIDRRDERFGKLDDYL